MLKLYGATVGSIIFKTTFLGGFASVWPAHKENSAKEHLDKSKHKIQGL